MLHSKGLDVLRKLSVLRAPEGKPFVLKSGKESMTYVDVRLTALNAHGLHILSDELHREVFLVKDGAVLVAGVALGGCPLATAVSLLSYRLDEVNPLNALYVRPEAKDHGTGKLVEGGFQPGDGVVLVEDVITSGGSSLKAMAALRDAGLVVKAVVAVLDREEGGGAKIAAEVPFRALYTLRELLGT
jgi:orotate phosphoribosyltransferase